jgi:hypothetical protein
MVAPELVYVTQVAPYRDGPAGSWPSWPTSASAG